MRPLTERYRLVTILILAAPATMAYFDASMDQYRRVANLLCYTPENMDLTRPDLPYFHLEPHLLPHPLYLPCPRFITHPGTHLDPAHIYDMCLLVSLPKWEADIPADF